MMTDLWTRFVLWLYKHGLIDGFDIEERDDV